MSEPVYAITDMVPDGSEALAGCFVARDYHGGQWSQLYRLSSSGCVTDLFLLAAELREAIAIADANGDYEDHEDLSALLAFVTTADDETE